MYRHGRNASDALADAFALANGWNAAELAAEISRRALANRLAHEELDAEESRGLTAFGKAHFEGRRSARHASHIPPSRASSAIRQELRCRCLRQ